MTKEQAEKLVETLEEFIKSSHDFHRHPSNITGAEYEKHYDIKEELVKQLQVL